MRALGVFLESNPIFGTTIRPRFDGACALDPAFDPRWRAWRWDMTARMGTLLPPGTQALPAFP